MAAPSVVNTDGLSRIGMSGRIACDVDTKCVDVKLIVPLQ